MAKTPVLLLALCLFAPLAAAQNETGGGNDGGDTDIFVNPPDNVDIDVTDNDNDPDESVGVGWSATTILIVVVVAVLLIALIVGIASRDRW